jgi:hypothetical protein
VFGKETKLSISLHYKRERERERERIVRSFEKRVRERERKKERERESFACPLNLFFQKRKNFRYEKQRERKIRKIIMQTSQQNERNILH